MHRSYPPWLVVFTIVEGMSALPPIADIGTQSRDVRFVPKADISRIARRKKRHGGLARRRKDTACAYDRPPRNLAARKDKVEEFLAVVPFELERVIFQILDNLVFLIVGELVEILATKFSTVGRVERYVWIGSIAPGRGPATDSRHDFVQKRCFTYLPQWFSAFS